MTQQPKVDRKKQERYRLVMNFRNQKRIWKRMSLNEKETYNYCFVRYIKQNPFDPKEYRKQLERSDYCRRIQGRIEEPFSCGFIERSVVLWFENAVIFMWIAFLWLGVVFTVWLPFPLFFL